MVSFSKIVSSVGLALTAFVSGAAAQQPAESCILDTYAFAVGGGSQSGGSPLCMAKWKVGVLPKALEVQGYKNVIMGITVTYTDNTYDIIGRMDGFRDQDSSRRQKIEWDPTADVVTKFQIWENGWNGIDDLAVGKILVDVSNGAHLEIGSDYFNEVPPTNIATGNSGMVLGAWGRGGDSVDRFELIFAKEKIFKRSINDIVITPPMEEINLRQSNSERGFNVEYLDEVHHVNNLDTATEVILRGEKKLVTSTALTKTSSDTFHLGMGFEFTASIGVPLLAESKLTTRTDMFWEHTTTRTTTTTETREDNKIWQQTATAQPGEAIRCFAWTFAAVPQDIRWSGTIKIEFEDGSIMTYPSRGQYNTAQYSRVSTSCEKEPIEDAITASSMGAKVYEDGKPMKRRSIGGGSARRAM